MRVRIPKVIAAFVGDRAGNACEYCRLPQRFQEATFHIDHIQPLIDGGSSSIENLAVACVTCSLAKVARTQAQDPTTKKMARLFHPRQHRWLAHFRWLAGWEIAGRTPTGRATIHQLRMNRFALIQIRQIWAEAGLFPPEN